MDRIWFLLLESNKTRLLSHICLKSKARYKAVRQQLIINIMTVSDGITSEDVYVIFIEVVSKMARKCKIND